MSGVIRWCLNNKSVVFLVTIIVAVSGVYAATQLNEELLPNVEFPALTISTAVPGAGPDVVDEQVTQPIEDVISDAEDIEGIQATSSQGFSTFVVEFALGTDPQDAEDELNRLLEGIELPEEAEAPEVQTASLSDIPVYSISLAAQDGDLQALSDYARDTAVTELEDVEGVASADLLGGVEQEIRVDLDLDALRESGLPAEAVVGAISGANTNSPVGSVEIDGLSTPVRTTSEASTVEELRELPISAASLGAAPASGDAASASQPSASQPPSGAAASGETPQTVTLGDIADVSEVEENVAGISRSDGEPSVGINVIKERDANTVEVARGVEDVFDDLRDDLGSDRVDVIFNSAQDVEQSVDSLIEKALLGGILAIVVIFFFLRSLRATLVTAVSLPVSILAALLFSWADNLTLNLITLAGLTIAVGRVVDDAIVVLENSYRYFQKGYDPEEAAFRGTTEVASAITSSTLTTVAVFLPLGLVGGIVSEFFLPLSLTVAFALLASLIVAVTVIPVLISIFIGRRAKRETEADSSPQLDFDEGSEGPVRRSSGSMGTGLRVLFGGAALLLTSVACLAVALLAGALEPEDILESNVVLGTFAALTAALAVGFVVVLFRSGRSDTGNEGSGDVHGTEESRLTAIYTPMLRWSLRHRVAVALIALVAFAGGLAIIPLLPVSFFPASEENLLSLDIQTEPGTSEDQTASEIEPFEDFLVDDPGVRSYQLSIAGQDAFGTIGAVTQGNQAQGFVSVREDSDVQNTLQRIREEGRDLYGDDFQAQILSQGPQTGGLEIEITGGSEEEQREASDTIVAELDDIDGITNVQSGVSDEIPEIQVDLDQDRAAEAGLSPSGLATTVGTLLGGGPGIEVGDRTVTVTAPEEDVDTVAEVSDLPAGPGVTLGDVSDVTERNAPTAIGRSDGEVAVTVTGAITDADTSGVSAEVEEALTELDFPDGVNAAVGGESEEISESFQDLIISIFVALAIVYLILVVFFRSVLVPLVILLAVPLTTVGAFGALAITGNSLSVTSLLGVLLLIGIVVANAILLVDFITSASRTSETLDDAILEAGRARLRPILMTALATIFALIPLALGIGGGGNLLVSENLSIPVIGGLITSTLLTLIVVPVGYSLLREPRRKKGHEWR